MRRWKSHLVVLAFLVAGLAGGLGWISWRCQIPVASPLERLYQDGNRRALIIYHPSYIDDFQQAISLRLAAGLARRGWQVRRITADPETVGALDFESYDTLIVGTNTYYWRIDHPSRDTLTALPNLAGRNCAGIVTGFGATAAAEAQLTALLREKGCDDPRVHALWLLRPNDETRPEADNREVALNRAEFLGGALGEWWSRVRLRD